MPKYNHPVRLRMNGRGISSIEMIGILKKEYDFTISEGMLSGAFSGKCRNDKAMKALDLIRKYLDGLENRKEV